jgi:uncharacterized protein (DUF302 family)
MMKKELSYGFGRTVKLPYDEAVERTRKALAEQGFGVLTEIDVCETLKKKLDVEFRPYVILGACNPGLAHRALTSELDIGLLLPCNVIVYGVDGESSVVEAMDPVAALSLTGREDIREIAFEVKDRLQKAIAALPQSL